MNTRKLRCYLVAFASFAGIFASSATWPEQMDCSGTKKSKAAPYTEVIRPGDRPDHEMIQAIRIHIISSKDPDFDGSEQTVYAHHDEYAHAGTQAGYFLYTLKSGEKIWAKFNSVNSRTGTQDSWEFTYQGVFRFIGGTGKYAHIRGGGHYQGNVRPSTGFEEISVCFAEY